MTEKTLATFRIDPSEWDNFKGAAMAVGSNASALLTEFVHWFVAGNRLSPTVVTPDPTPTHLDNSVQKRLDGLEEYIDKLPASLDELIDQRIEERLASSLGEMRSHLEELQRGKSKAR